MITIDLASLCKPHPRKWFYPLTLVREDGHELVCQSGLPRLATRLFLREHKLLEFFDDILYDFSDSPTITTIPELLPFTRRDWVRERLTFAVFYSGT